MSMTYRAVVVLRILLALLFVGLLVGQTLSIPQPRPLRRPRYADAHVRHGVGRRHRVLECQPGDLLEWVAD